MHSLEKGDAVTRNWTKLEVEGCRHSGMETQSLDIGLNSDLGDAESRTGI